MGATVSIGLPMVAPQLGAGIPMGGSHAFELAVRRMEQRINGMVFMVICRVGIQQRSGSHAPHCPVQPRMEQVVQREICGGRTESENQEDKSGFPWRKNDGDALPTGADGSAADP